MPSRPLCVYCRQRAVEDRFRPFCSERCQVADLGRWLNGHYQVAGEAAAGSDGPGADLLEDPVDDDGPIR